MGILGTRQVEEVVCILNRLRSLSLDLLSEEKGTAGVWCLFELQLVGLE